MEAKATNLSWRTTDAFLAPLPAFGELMTLELEPTEGDVRKNPHLRIGRYNPPSEDVP